MTEMTGTTTKALAELLVCFSLNMAKGKTSMLNVPETRRYLKESDFGNLFTQELGWDYHTQTPNITIDETEYRLTAIAEKRGMVVFECVEARLPDYPTRRKIQKRVAKSVHEHFIIYTDAEKTTQIWQWVKREQGKPDACREHRYNRDTHSGEIPHPEIANHCFQS